MPTLAYTGHRQTQPAQPYLTAAGLSRRALAEKAGGRNYSSNSPNRRRIVSSLRLRK
jgi:hypothetical protein